MKTQVEMGMMPSWVLAAARSRERGIGLILPQSLQKELPC